MRAADRRRGSRCRPDLPRERWAVRARPEVAHRAIDPLARRCQPSFTRDCWRLCTAQEGGGGLPRAVPASVARDERTWWTPRYGGGPGKLRDPGLRGPIVAWTSPSHGKSPTHPERRMFEHGSPPPPSVQLIDKPAPRTATPRSIRSLAAANPLSRVTAGGSALRRRVGVGCRAQFRHRWRVTRGHGGRPATVAGRGSSAIPACALPSPRGRARRMGRALPSPSAGCLSTAAHPHPPYNSSTNPRAINHDTASPTWRS